MRDSYALTADSQGAAASGSYRWSLCENSLGARTSHVQIAEFPAFAS
jgi:hypothetical protein